jgi:hypothetical protein
MSSVLYSIFPHYLINGTIFEKKKIDIKCVFWLSPHFAPETFLILRRIEGGMIKKYILIFMKVPVGLVRFCWNLNILDWFSENIQISNLMKILPVGAELFNAGGQTDRQTRDEANSPFSQSCENTAKNGCLYTSLGIRTRGFQTLQISCFLSLVCKPWIRLRSFSLT